MSGPHPVLVAGMDTRVLAEVALLRERLHADVAGERPIRVMDSHVAFNLRARREYLVALAARELLLDDVDEHARERRQGTSLRRHHP